MVAFRERCRALRSRVGRAPRLGEPDGAPTSPRASSSSAPRPRGDRGLGASWTSIDSSARRFVVDFDRTWSVARNGARLPVLPSRPGRPQRRPRRPGRGERVEALDAGLAPRSPRSRACGWSTADPALRLRRRQRAVAGPSLPRRKPWLEPHAPGVYSRLLRRLLIGTELAIRVPDGDPARLRSGPARRRRATRGSTRASGSAAASSTASPSAAHARRGTAMQRTPTSRRRLLLRLRRALLPRRRRR